MRTKFIGVARVFAIFTTPAFLMGGSQCLAAETISYTYDVHGRLVAVIRTGTVNSGVTATYTYDSADNRSNVTVTGSPNTPPS